MWHAILFWCLFKSPGILVGVLQKPGVLRLAPRDQYDPIMLSGYSDHVLYAARATQLPHCLVSHDVAHALLQYFMLLAIIICSIISGIFMGYSLFPQAICNLKI